MPWSYQEDILLLICKDPANKLQSDFPNRSTQQIRLRRKQLENTTIETLEEEREFILENYTKLTVRDLAKCLKLTSNMVSRRINAMKREGDIDVDKPRFTDISQEERERIIENMVGMSPMKKEMIVPYSEAPKGSLIKNKIQEDRLEVGKEYKIITVSTKGKIRKTKMKLICCYPNHYLFQTDRGIKHSLSKVNLAIGEWKCEKVI